MSVEIPFPVGDAALAYLWKLKAELHSDTQDTTGCLTDPTSEPHDPSQVAEL